MQQNPLGMKAVRDGVTCQHREMVQQLCDLPVATHPEQQIMGPATHSLFQALPEVSALKELYLSCRVCTYFHNQTPTVEDAWQNHKKPSCSWLILTAIPWGEKKQDSSNTLTTYAGHQCCLLLPQGLVITLECHSAMYTSEEPEIKA